MAHSTYPRLIRKHFEGCDSLAALEEERESRHTDRSERFRKVAVSAVVSWFASGDYNRSFMMQHAVQGCLATAVLRKSPRLRKAARPEFGNRRGAALGLFYRRSIVWVGEGQKSGAAVLRKFAPK